MPFFEYGKTETEHLSRADPQLGEAIQRIGIVERQVNPDLFASLAHSIVSQQITNRAAAAIWGRVTSLLGSVTPESVCASTAAALRECGLSAPKAGYLLGIAESVTKGRLDIADLKRQPDEEVIRRLTALKGIGIWTAEMLLIFSLQRPDVVSWGDFAIRRGMTRLYHLDELNRPVFNEYRRRYTPYGTVASFYLWEVSRLEDW